MYSIDNGINEIIKYVITGGLGLFALIICALFFCGRKIKKTENDSKVKYSKKKIKKRKQRINNNKTKNLIPNLQFYKKIIESNSTTKFLIFDAYNLNIEDETNNNYLSVGNNESKTIDIYKINSKDDINLIKKIKIGFDDINFIKYYYDSYHDCHYLITLIDKRTKVLLYKITGVNKYELIFQHSEICSQGGICMGYSPIHYRFCDLLFNQENSFLFLFYVLQRGCCSRVAYFDIFDFITKKKYILKQKDAFYKEYEYISRLDERIKRIYDINRDNKNYFGFLNYDSFCLYNLSLSNLISCSDETKKIKIQNEVQAEIIKIRKEINNKYKAYKDGILIKENNGDECFYLYQVNNDNNKTKIVKISIKNKDIIYISELNNDSIISMKIWNEKYLLIFVENGQNILLFNIILGKIEKKFNHGKDILCDGNKIIINDTEELLFVTDDKGSLNLWVNSQY